MISTHAFEAWHVDAMGPIVSELSDIETHREFIKGFKKSVDNHAVTIALDETPIAVIGGTFKYPHVMEVFSLLSEDIRKKPLAFHKEVKRIIQAYFDECELNRMQMEVNADHEKAFYWAMSLGFHMECKMKHYGVENTDYYLFARYQ